MKIFIELETTSVRSLDSIVKHLASILPQTDHIRV